MGIKDQIKDSIHKVRAFALADAGSNDIDRFKRLALNFINSKTYGEASENASNLLDFSLDIHVKTQTMGPIIRSMRDFELEGEYQYKKQRTHYIHSVNIFLLGLFIYHGCSKIRNAINNEMVHTSIEKTIRFEGDVSDWHYSGGSIEGEFFYRWRLCSLCHDIGYPVSLVNNRKELDSYLTDKFGINGINSLKNDKVLPDNEMLLEFILDIMQYIDIKERKPAPGNEMYDHGIMGGLIFLHKMDKLFKSKSPIEKVNGKRIIWDRVVFNTSLKEVSNAVAMHNLEMHEEALKKSLFNPDDLKIHDIDKHALSWLLKVTDILQEWDKIKASEYNENKSIPTQNIEIETNPESIVVQGFNAKQKEKIDEKLNILFKQPSIVQLL